MGGVVFGDISYSDESFQGIHEKLWKRCGDPGRQNDKEPRPGSSCRVQGKHNYEEKNEEDEEAAASIVFNGWWGMSSGMSVGIE